MFFQDPYIPWTKLNAQIDFDRKTHHFQEIVILIEQQNAKSGMVKFISKNSNILEMVHSLINSPTIIPRYGFHFRSTDIADKPPFTGFRVNL